MIKNNTKFDFLLDFSAFLCYTVFHTKDKGTVVWQIKGAGIYSLYRRVDAPFLFHRKDLAAVKCESVWLPLVDKGIHASSAVGACSAAAETEYDCASNLSGSPADFTCSSLKQHVIINVDISKKFFKKRREKKKW